MNWTLQLPQEPGYYLWNDPTCSEPYGVACVVEVPPGFGWAVGVEFFGWEVDGAFLGLRYGPDLIADRRIMWKSLKEFIESK